MKNSTNMFTVVLALALVLGLGCKSDVELLANSDPAPVDEVDKTDEHGDDTHADIEEPEGTVEAGAFTGSWRIATRSDDNPAVYLDLLHAVDESELSGDFKMGPAVAERLDGQTGAILGGTATDGGVTVRFNPTTDPEEVYTLEASGTDTMTGTVTAKKNTELRLEVTVVPLVVD